jgi:hypothetical protein
MATKEPDPNKLAQLNKTGVSWASEALSSSGFVMERKLYNRDRSMAKVAGVSLSRGKHYFECTCERGAWFNVGFIDLLFKPTSKLGADKHSWVLSVSWLLLAEHHGTKHDCKKRYPAIKKNVTLWNNLIVGCALDLDKRSCEYYVQNIGSPFPPVVIHGHEHMQVSGALVPLIAWDEMKAAVNLGAAPFHFEVLRAKGMFQPIADAIQQTPSGGTVTTTGGDASVFVSSTANVATPGGSGVASGEYEFWHMHGPSLHSFGSMASKMSSQQQPRLRVTAGEPFVQFKGESNVLCTGAMVRRKQCLTLAHLHYIVNFVFM